MDRYTIIDPATSSHNCNLRMVVKDHSGVLQFLAYTGWNESNTYDKIALFPGHDLCHIKGVDVSVHAYEQIEEGFGVPTDYCKLLDDKKCWAAFYSLKSIGMLNLLISGGSGAVFEELEKFHAEVFYGTKSRDS